MVTKIYLKQLREKIPAHPTIWEYRMGTIVAVGGGGEQTRTKVGHFIPAPTIDKARPALENLKNILKTQCTGPGYKDP